QTVPRPVRRSDAAQRQRPGQDHRRLGAGGRTGQGQRRGTEGEWPMSASIRAEADGQLLLAGVLDFRTGPALREQGRTLIRASRAATLCLDLTAVEKSSSVGLALLLAYLRDAEAAGKTLRVRALPADMRQIAE